MEDYNIIGLKEMEIEKLNILNELHNLGGKYDENRKYCSDDEEYLHYVKYGMSRETKAYYKRTENIYCRGYGCKIHANAQTGYHCVDCYDKVYKQTEDLYPATLLTCEEMELKCELDKQLLQLEYEIAEMNIVEMEKCDNIIKRLGDQYKKFTQSENSGLLLSAEDLKAYMQLSRDLLKYIHL